MPINDKENTVEETTDAVNGNEATDTAAAESNADANDEAQSANAGSAGEQTSAGNEEPTIVGSIIDTVASAVESVAETVAGGISTVVNTVTGADSEGETKETNRKRAEKVGIVASDKMTKTVTVRVDRQVKHPIYRKYVKRRKKFMAHDELGSAVGDKVRIIETRPLSARKRWRVVEILHKAEK